MCRHTSFYCALQILHFLNLFLFLAALGLCCLVQAFSSCGECGHLFIAVCGLLTAVASLVQNTGCRLQWLQQAGSVAAACRFYSVGSGAVAHRLSCSTACGVLPNQVLNPCPLHWQEDSHPQCHQGSPTFFFFFTNLNICALCRASLWTQFFNSVVLKLRHRDFPDRPVVKTSHFPSCFQCREHLFQL